MYVIPDGEVRLLKNCPLKNMTETIYFANKTQQFEYFSNLSIETNLILEHVSFIQDAPGVIRVPLPYSQVYNVQYMMYKNTGFLDKWFYAFVRRVEYTANNTSTIYFEIDDMQTWFMQHDFDPQLNLRECFVKRNHSRTDNFGDNIVEENIGFGEKVYSYIYFDDYVVDEIPIPYTEGVRVGFCTTLHIEDTSYKGGMSTLKPNLSNPFFNAKFSTPVDRGEEEKGFGCYKYNNYISGGKYYIFLKEGDVVTYDNEQYTVSKADEALAQAIFSDIINDGHSDFILSLFMLPGGGINYESVNNTITGFTDGDKAWVEAQFDAPYPKTMGFGAIKFDEPVTPTNGTFSIELPTIDGYKPKNNKLFTYPYCSLFATDQNGSELLLKPEFFNRFAVNPDEDQNIFVNSSGELVMNNLAFKVYGTMQVPSSTRVCFPRYKGLRDDVSNGIEIGPYPMCSWKSGTYERWLAQNSAPMVAGAFSSLMNQGYGSIGERTTQTVGSEYMPRRTVGVNRDGWQPTSSHLWSKRDVTKSYPTSSSVEGLGGLISNTASNAWSNLASIASASHLPEKANGIIGNSNIFFDNEKQKCVIRAVTLNSNDAMIIDEYFTRFGYAQNIVTRPNINARPYWTYVETSGCVIDANIPLDVEESLSTLFDNGVTFFRYRPNEAIHVGYYNRDNSPET